MTEWSTNPILQGKWNNFTQIQSNNEKKKVSGILYCDVWATWVSNILL